MLSLHVVAFSAMILTKGLVACFYLDEPMYALPRAAEGWWLGPGLLLFTFSMEDVAFGLVCLLLGLGALRLATTVWSRRIVLVSAHVAAIAIVLFMLGNLKLFGVYGEFLRADLLPLGVGPWLVPNSFVLQAVGVSTGLALILLPPSCLLAHWAGLRVFSSFWCALGRLACRPALIAVLALVLFIVAPALRRQTGLNDCDYGRSPHILFLVSLFDRPIGREDDGEPGTHEPVTGQPLRTGRLLADPPKNLILIVAESVDVRHIETYGCSLRTTPNLRRLAPISLTFDRFYAAANYSFGSSMPIFTGIGADPAVISPTESRPGFKTPSVAKHFQSLGYRTYLFAAGGKSQWEDYLGFLIRFYTEGFDVGRNPAHAFWQKAARPDSFLFYSYSDTLMFADARRAVHESASNRFAILLWTSDTHYPYNDDPGPDSLVRSEMPLWVRLSENWKREYFSYVKSIWRLDRLIGELYDDLVSLGIAEDTLIVVTGDHGESFGEHGTYGHWRALYEDQVHVPLVFINPRVAALGARNTTVGGHVDLWPTIADVCSLPVDPSWQGRSLIREDAVEGRAYFFSGRLDYYGMCEGRWKYFFKRSPYRHFLFDLETDPDERINLAGELSDRRDRLCRLVNAWRKSQHTFNNKLNR